MRAGPLTLKAVPQRVRGIRAGETVLDTRAALLLWEDGVRLCRYAVPAADLRPGVPARAFPGLAGMAGRLAVDWETMDTWLEEDEVALGHPRHPYHRVDLRRSGRRVRVAVDGAVVAQSERPLLVLETDLPLRAYLPAADVRMDALRPTATRTVCAYKGVASYWAVGDHPDLAWTYAEPLPEAQRLRGLICFLNERVDLELDGELLERPRTHWSAGLRSNLRGGPSGAGPAP